MQAFRLLETMRKVGLSPDQGTCDTLIATCAKAAAAGDPDGAEYGLRVLGMMAEEGLTPDAAMRNALMGECLRVAEQNAAAAGCSDELDPGTEGAPPVDDTEGIQGWHGVEWIARALGAMAHHLAASGERPSDEASALAWDAGEAVGRRLYNRLALLCVKHVSALARGAELPDSEAAVGQSNEETSPPEHPTRTENADPMAPALNSEAPAVDEERKTEVDVGAADSTGVVERNATLDPVPANGEWWDAQIPDSGATCADDAAPVMGRGLSPQGVPKGAVNGRREQLRTVAVRWPACEGCGVGVGGLRRRDVENSGVSVPVGDVGIETGLSGHISQELFARLQRLASQQLQDLRHHRQQLQARDATTPTAEVGSVASEASVGVDDAAQLGGAEKFADSASGLAMQGVPSAMEMAAAAEPQTPLSNIRSKVVAFSQTVLDEIEQIKEQQAAAGERGIVGSSVVLAGAVAESSTGTGHHHLQGSLSESRPFVQTVGSGQWPRESVATEKTVQEGPKAAWCGDSEGNVHRGAGLSTPAGYSALPTTGVGIPDPLKSAVVGTVPGVIPALLSLPVVVPMDAAASQGLIASTVAVIAPSPAVLLSNGATCLPAVALGGSQSSAGGALSGQNPGGHADMPTGTRRALFRSTPPPASPPPGGPADATAGSGRPEGLSPGPRRRGRSPSPDSSEPRAAWLSSATGGWEEVGYGGGTAGGSGANHENRGAESGGRAEPPGGVARRGDRTTAHGPPADVAKGAESSRDAAGAALRKMDVEQVRPLATRPPFG